LDGYLWLKALHVGAAVTWIGGMLAASLALTTQLDAPRRPKTAGVAALDVVRRWDRRVTTPAMLLVWAAGITMAMLGHWFAAPWLMVKLAIVLVLSAVHGLLSGTLRALERHGDRSPSPSLRYVAPVTIAGVFVIAVLAIAKPF
jgi:protoporphyrinogen IX oxidase